MTWEALGLTLIEASIIRPVVLVLAVLAILRVFRIRRRVDPASEHAIWAAALAGMLLIPIVSVWMPHLNIPVMPATRIVDRIEPAVTTISLPAVSETAPESIDRLAQQRTVPEIQRPSLAIAPHPPIPVSAIRAPFDSGMLVIWIYLAGFLAMMVSRGTGWILLRRVLFRSGPQRRGLLRESGDVVIPVTAGVIRPVVLLPSGWNEWDVRLRRVVLAHEFEHIRRRDTLVSAFGRAVTSLLWFQPLAWWMIRKISESSEMACDMAAAKAAENPAAYAQILLDFSARIHRAGHRATLPGLAIAGGLGLGRRVDRLLEGPDLARRRLKWPLAKLSLVGVPVLCLAATLGVTGMPQPLRIVPAFPIPQPPSFALPASSSPLSVAAVQTPGIQTDIVSIAGRLFEELGFAAPFRPSPILVAVGEQNVPAIQAPQPPTNMGAITGRLLLADGSPAPNIEVAAMLGPVDDRGAKTWSQVRRVRTDSDGRFRIEVLPGGYTVATLIGAYFYYPGVTDVDRLIPVTVTAGKTVEGVNFRMDISSGVRVRGRLVPPPGEASSSILVGLGDSAEFYNPFSYHTYYGDIGLVPVQPDGSFEFPVVPQSVYALRVFPVATANPHPILIAGEPTNFVQTFTYFGAEPGYRIDVARTDVRGVEVPFGVLVSAQIGMENGESLPALIADRLVFSSDNLDVSFKGASSTDAVALALPAGQHRIFVGLPFGYYMKTFSYGTTDLLREPLSLTSPATEEIIGTITAIPPPNAAKSVTVRGRATSPSSSSRRFGYRGPLKVVLTASGSGGFGDAPLQDDGTFEFRNVPAGTYSAFVTASSVAAQGLSPIPKTVTVVVADADLSGVEVPVEPSLIDKR